MKQMKKRILSIFAASSIAFAGLAFPGSALQKTADYDIPIIVSIGDSYSSGEGMPEFYGQDKPVEEKVLDYDWIAHRSKKAWSGKLTLPGVEGTMSEHRGTNWFFAASSSAETTHITGTQTRKYNYQGLEGTVDLPAQLDIFDGLTLTDNDYVILSIGGNDIGFEDAMTALVTKSEQDLVAYVESKYAEFNTTVKGKMKQAYRTIAQTAGEETSIIVAGYPTLLNKDGFTILVFFEIAPEKVALLNGIDNWFNDQIKGMVEELNGEGLNIHFVDVRGGFLGHEAYTETPYINEILFGAQPEDINQKSYVSAYSIHPNEDGAAIYAEAVQNKIDALEAARRLEALSEKDDAPGVEDIISEGSIALKGMEYDFTLTPAQNRQLIDESAEGATENLHTARRNELESRIAAEKDLITAEAGKYDNSEVNRVAAEIIQSLDEITYNPQKSFADNVSTVSRLHKVFTDAVRSIYNRGTSGGESSSPAGTSSTPVSSDTSGSTETAKAKMSASLNSDRSVTVSWDKISDAKKYILYAEIDGQEYKMTETTKTKVKLYGKLLKNNVTIKYKLKYVYGGVTCDAPAGYTASLKVYFKPAVKLTQNDGRVTASWKKVENAESYKVYKLVNGKMKLVCETSKNAVRFTAKPGRTYTYSVSAVVNGEETPLVKSDRVSITVK